MMNKKSKPRMLLQQIETTMEYDVFERMPGNRVVDERHVIRLMEAMQHKDLFVPIIINTNFEVIDGQHRLEARRRLGIPVPYVVAGDYGLQDVQTLNSKMKAWNTDDFAKSYIELGNKDYEVYLWFKKQYELPHAVAMALLSKRGINSGGGAGNSDTVLFRSGQFKVVDIEYAKGVAESLLKLRPYFSHWNNRSFISAIVFCLGKKAFNFKQFLARVAQYPDMLRPCATTDLYIENIEKVFNYRSSNKVSLRFGEDK